MPRQRTFTLERDVKRAVKDYLTSLGACHFMPPAGEFGRAGVSDIIAVVKGKALAIETKFGIRKPTALQLEFGRRWQEAGGYFFVVSDRNLEDWKRELIELLETSNDAGDL